MVNHTNAFEANQNNTNHYAVSVTMIQGSVQYNISEAFVLVQEGALDCMLHIIRSEPI